MQFALALCLLTAAVVLLVVSTGDRHDPRTRSVLVAFELLLLVHYQYWRLTGSLPEAELSFGALFGYSLYGLELLLLHSRYSGLLRLTRFRSRSDEVVRNQEWLTQMLNGATRAPLVDVLIPTYNEPREVLERTVLGARAIDYPRKRVWLLDDGDRDWVRDLASELGLHYLRRSDNRHFKAGNLNSGLAAIKKLEEQPEFVLVLDADFVPQRDFLRRTLALMKDPATACVQTPQIFYNADPFQYSFKAQDHWPDDQRVWFEHELPTLDAVNAAICCGTSFVVRMSALERIGGFPTESICEDALSTFKLRRLGLRTVYLNERLSIGLAPEGVREFLTQRGRWCLGMIQIALSPWGTPAKYTGPRRWLATTDALAWSISALYRAMWISVPILYWWFGVSALDATSEDILRFVAPLLLMRVAFSWLSGWTVIPIITDAAHVLAAPAVLRATWQALTRPNDQGFNVTAKGLSRERVVVHWNLLLWFAVPAILLLMGLIDAVLAGRFGGWIAAFSVLQLVLLVIAGAPCIEQPKYRSSERFSVDCRGLVQVEGREYPAEVADLSETGSRIRTAAPVRIGQESRLLFPEIGAFDARAVRLSNAGELCLAFEIPESSRRLLTEFLYCKSGAALRHRRWSGVRCWGAVMRKLCWT